MEMCANKFIAAFFVPGGKICFVTFMAISTWFLVDQRFRLSRFLKMWFLVGSITAIFTVVSYILGAPVTWSEWVGAFLPMMGNSHGFAATYLGFYLLLPILLIVKEHITTKPQLLYVLAVLAYFQLAGQFAPNGHQLLFASELTLFVFYFFLTLYLKRYPVKFLQSTKKCFAAFVIVWFLFIGLLGGAYMDVFGNFKVFVVLLCRDESSLLPIIGGYLLFFVFKNREIAYNSLINHLATGAFAVLLMHDHNIFRNVMWHQLLSAESFYYSPWFIVWIGGSVVLIYATGWILNEAVSKGINRIVDSTYVKKLKIAGLES